MLDKVKGIFVFWILGFVFFGGISYSEVKQVEVQEILGAKVLRLGKLEIQILPTGAIGAGIGSEGLIWDKIYCILNAVDYKNVASSLKPLETQKVEVKKEKNGVTIVSNFIVGEKEGTGKWTCVQELFLNNNGKMSLIYKLDKISDPVLTVRYSYLTLYLPRKIYKDSKAIVNAGIKVFEGNKEEDIEGKPDEIKFDFKYQGYKEIESVQLMPGKKSWKVVVDEGIESLGLHDYGYADTIELIKIYFTLPDSITMSITCDLSELL